MNLLAAPYPWTNCYQIVKITNCKNNHFVVSDADSFSLQKILELLRQIRPMQTECKGYPFHFLLFYCILQTRTTLKGPFGTAHFFSKIFTCLQRVPLRDSLIICNKMYVNKSQGVPFFGTIGHFPKRKNPKFFHLKNVVLFPVGEKVVSQSYGAWKAPFGCLKTVAWAFHNYVLGIF